MRTVSYDECDSFDEVRRLFERVFSEIDDINFILGPTREKNKEILAKFKVKAEAKAKALAAANAEAREIADAKALIARIESAEKANDEAEAKAKETAKAKAAAIARAKKIIAEARPTKRKRKGFVQMKTLIGMCVIVLMLVTAAFGQEVWRIDYDNCSNPENLVRLLRTRFSNLTSNSYLFTPTTTAPAHAEGKVYYNDDTDSLQLSNGTAWASIDSAGGVSLDGAYDWSSAGGGKTILATDGAVTISNTEADSASLLSLSYTTGAQTGDGITITLANGTADGIEFENTGSGYDIEGTGALWYATAAGAVYMTTGTTAGDFLFTGNAYNWEYDNSSDTLHALDNAELGIGGTTGADGDIIFRGDGTNVVIETAVEDLADILVGYTNALDWTHYGSTNTLWLKHDVSAAETYLTHWDIQLNDDSDIIIGSDNDWVIEDDTGDSLEILSKITTETGVVNIGKNTEGVDFKLYGATDADYAIWDASGDQWYHVGSDIRYDDDSLIRLGTGASAAGDVTLQFDSTNLELFSVATASMPFAIGGTTYGFDITYYFETAGTIFADYTGDYVDYSDDMEIRFGTGVGTLDGDFKISSNSSAVLQIEQVVADTGTVEWAIDGTGMDMTWHGETASSYMKWVGNTATQLQMVSATGSGTLFAITAVDTGGDSDTFTIAHSGAGAALQITSSEADTQLIELITKQNQTTWLQLIDGASGTGGWIGDDDVGMLTLKADSATTETGTSLLNIQHTATPVASAEGYLARFVSTGTATTTAHAVEIETTLTQPCLMLNNLLTITGADSSGTIMKVTHNDASGDTDAITVNSDGTGAGMKMIADSATSLQLELAAAASQSTSMALIDGGTDANWIGADDIGMVHIYHDTALTTNGATQLMVRSIAQPKSGAEGFLARFEQVTGGARTDAYAVEIETTATTPCLMLNNEMTITGASSSAGLLLGITSTDTTTDTVNLTGAGTGDVLQITANATTAQALNVLCKASATETMVKFDGATYNWIGAADNNSMVEILGDTANAHTGGSLLLVNNSAQALASSEGFLARFVASGSAQTNATAVEIEVAATQPALAINGITKINGQDAAGATLFQVAGVGASGNADAMSVSNTGTGNCITVSPGGATTDGIIATAYADATVPLITLDGATNDFDGATGVGILTITQDTAFVHEKASALVISQTGVVKSDAEGFLARFVSSATRQTAAHAVEIETTLAQPALMLNSRLTITGANSGGTLVAITGNDANSDSDTMTVNSDGTGAGLKMIADSTTSMQLEIASCEQQTTNMVLIDGATDANWIGGNDVGMLTMKQDTQLGNTGASLIVLQNTAQQASGSEGFLLRLVDTGTATADAYAMEIETTNTTPCLFLNNELNITGADQSGTLLTIAHTGAAGNADAMVMTHNGSGDALQITQGDVDSRAVNLIASSGQTVATLNIDATTGWFAGADEVGLIDIVVDGNLAHVDTSALVIESSAIPQNSAMGTCLRIVDSGNAASGTGYSVYISTTDAQMDAIKVDNGDVIFDETLTVTGVTTLTGAVTATAGVQSASVAVDANDEGAQVTIVAGSRYVTVTITNDATDVVILPTAVVGNIITICVPTTGCELQTAVAGSDEINGVDCSGGNEMAMAAGSIYTLTCNVVNKWIAHGWDTAGAAQATIVPDSD